MKSVSATMLAGLFAVAAALPSQAADFNGFHVGIGAGINDTDLKLRGDSGERVSAGNSDGELIFFAGYDHEFPGRLVLGVDFEAAVRGDSGDELDDPDSFNFDFFDSMLSVSLRGGVLLTDSVLAYAKIGYANLEVGQQNFNGVRFGGGIEANLFWRVALRGEVLHARFSSQRIEEVALRGKPNATQARIGLLLRF